MSTRPSSDVTERLIADAEAHERLLADYDTDDTFTITAQIERLAAAEILALRRQVAQMRERRRR